MAMEVSRANKFALTVSADHIVGYYDLTVRISLFVGPVKVLTAPLDSVDRYPSRWSRCRIPNEAPWKWFTGNPRRRQGLRSGRLGRKVRFLFPFSSLSFLLTNANRIRLYSTKSFKSLGILKYHKSAAQCLVFARAIVNSSHSEMHKEDMDMQDKIEQSKWLVAGSKDCRVSIWSLISFAK